MKQTILLAAMALVGTSAVCAQDQKPIWYGENFVEMGRKSDILTDGWTSTGIDAVPLGDAKNPGSNLKMYYGTLLDNTDPQYPVYGAPYHNYILLNYGAKCSPISCTNFEDGEQADQWMISPEIEIPENTATLKFDVVGYTTSTWGTAQAPFSVMVSETGTDKENFTEVYSYSFSPTTNQEVASRSFIIPLNEYGGKKVHLAFVNKGKGSGNIGFSDIELGQYAVQWTNTTERIGLKGDGIPVKINFGLKTSVTCPGFTATLEYNGKKVEKYFKKALGGRGTAWVFQMAEFSGADNIDLSDGKSVDYTVTIVPDFEGAKPTVVTGSILCPEYTFPSNVVLEEGTASGCGWCPRGIGAVHYYNDLIKDPQYDYAAKGQKFICINIHGQMNYYDPMNEGVEEYRANQITTAGSGTLPIGNFNRAIVGKGPEAADAVFTELDNTTLYKAEIAGIACNENLKIGDEVTVATDIFSGFTAETSGVSVAVVMIENDVQGMESGYKQENYLSKYYSNTQIGAPLIPNEYYTKFFSGGEFGVAEIPFSRMVYQEVARGIWPSYFGQNVTEGFVIGTPNRNLVTFEVPKNLINVDEKDNLIKDKYEIITLVLDNKTGEIVASDIKSLAESTAGVNTVGTSSDIKVARSGNQILVNGEGALKVALYTVDGVCLGTYEGNDNLNIDASALKGVVVVRAAGNNGTATGKIIF